MLSPTIMTYVVMPIVVVGISLLLTLAVMGLRGWFESRRRGDDL